MKKYFIHLVFEAHTLAGPISSSFMEIYTEEDTPFETYLLEQVQNYIGMAAERRGVTKSDVQCVFSNIYQIT